MNNCGYGDFSNNFAVDIQDCTGIDENSKSDFTIYPNPANDVLILQANGLKSENIRVSLMNVLGEVVIEKAFVNISGTPSKIDVSKLREGVYFIRIESLSETGLSKIIIKR